jgi:hypothetical protein
MLFFNNADYLMRVARRARCELHDAWLRALFSAAPPAMPVSLQWQKQLPSNQQIEVRILWPAPFT